MQDTAPILRKDLEFFPVQHGTQQLILIRDHLGLVPEGKAVAPPLYQLMSLLDGTRTVRDLQMELMRQKGGVLVGMDEVKSLLVHLEESYLLESERFRKARDQIVASFTSKRVRHCSHCGLTYPGNPSELKNKLNKIIASQPPVSEPEGKIKGLVSPHIDLSVGYKVYSSAYQMLNYTAPSRVVLLGVGHQMVSDLFCLTDKDFETPLGITKGEKSLIHELRGAGGDNIAANDFAHRSEHSIEFQLIFLQHLLQGKSFTIIPILCGFIQSCMPEYSREVYLEKTAPFLNVLRQILQDPDKQTLLVAGIDFSHIGPKFGHEMPAEYLKGRSEAHDKKLLQYLSTFDPDRFWEESRNVEDKFNVCGFSALACLLEILPSCKGQILNYQIWHEEPTRSAVSFAAVVFTS
ncbi:MAG: AmmeMemoRadiSam system protein B [Deltaproteobacteria bacterium]|nr:MAG: AmmeMemoRadiSam system protein B [Deltaproteobacteria bacterium]